MKRCIPYLLALSLLLTTLILFRAEAVSTTVEPGGVSATVSAANTPASARRMKDESDAAASQLPQRFSLTSGAQPGESHRDQFGTHHWHRQPRPFVVTHRTENYAWTSEDGKLPAVMKQLANNSEMLLQLEEDNAFTTQRQLVYVPAEFTAKAQEMLDGKRQEIVLPGLNGEEFKVQVTAHNVDTAEGADPVSGGFMGTIVGLPGSEVSGGAGGDHWSITIDPGHGKIYQIVNRNRGEWIVSAIDPTKQIVPPCPNDHTVDDVGAIAPNP